MDEAKRTSIFDQEKKKVWDVGGDNAIRAINLGSRIVETAAHIRRMEEDIESKKRDLASLKQSLGKALLSVLEPLEYESEREGTIAFNALVKGLGLRFNFAGECVAMEAARRKENENE